MIFTVILSLVEALPLGCLAQSIIMAAMFGGNAAFHALVRPRRWWVLNVHGTLVNVLLCLYCVFSGAGVGGGGITAAVCELPKFRDVNYRRRCVHHREILAAG